MKEKAPAFLKCLRKNMLTSETDNYKELALERSNLYFFLSSLFLKPPTLENAKTLKQLISLPEISRIVSAQAIQFLASVENINNGDLGNIIQEYHDLFKIPLSKYITPYESVYCDGRMNGQSYVMVKKTYNKFGFQIPYEYYDLPDHIGIELAFMATLCREEDKAYKGNNHELWLSILNIEKKFLKEHIICWLPDLCEKIFEKTKNSFYLALAKVTLEFILSDSNTLNEALN